MRSWFIKAPYRFELRTRGIPEPGDDEVLIRVRACGLCGTDMTSIKTAATDWQPVGHEIAGVIEKTGKNVAHVRVGNTVVLETGTFCRRCDNCRNGRYDLCNRGPTFWGGGPTMGFAEYVVAPQEVVVPYEGLSFAVAALTEPLGVAMDLVKTVEVKLGDDVLVLGLGPIGLMALRLARLAGARKIYAAARSHSTKRIATARQFGADEIICTDRTPLETYNEQGFFDKALVTSPPRTIPSALKAARVGACIGYIGIEYGDGATIAFDANDFHFRKLQLRASHASPALYFPLCLELLKSGRVDGEAIATPRFPLEAFPEAVLALRDERGQQVKPVMVID